MQPVKATVTFENASPMDLVALGRNHVTAMTGNANFTTPDVPLATITTQANAVEAAYIATQSPNHSIVDTAALNLATKNLVGSLKTNVRYVNHVAYNNKTRLLTTALPLSEEQPQSAGVPEQPQVKLRVPTETPGAVSISIATVTNARCFTVFIAEDGVDVAITGTGVECSGAVTIINDTHRAIAVTGLRPHTSYRLWVMATGTAGTSALSDGKKFTTQ